MSGRLPGGPLHEIERDLEHVEVAQAEEVHLEQPEVFDAVHLVLRDDRGVLDLAAVGLALDGQVLGERLARDDDGRGVDAVLAAQALEPARRRSRAWRRGRPRRARAGRRPSCSRRCSRRPVRGTPATACRGPSRAAASAWRSCRRRRRGSRARARSRARRPGLDGGERDDLRDMVGAVALGRVLDHLAAVAGVEVHVDVGHRLAARVEKALEEQVVADGVDAGDAQAVGDARPRRAPPPGTDADAACARSGRGPRPRGSTRRTPSS